MNINITQYIINRKLSYIVIGVILIAFMFFLSKSNSVEFQLKENTVGLRKKISLAFQRYDPDKTVTRFKASVQKLPQVRRHTPMHIFGEMVYEIFGLEGIQFCDDAFGFGCYHGLFGRAVAEKGESIVNALDQACIRAFGPKGLGCMHGIGHGLGEYFGPKRLLDQLAICKELSWKKQLFGCQGGVFMEYNFPTIVTGDTSITTARQLVSDRPYEPCPSVPKLFRQACYFDQAAWWQDVFHHDDRAIGTLCVAIVALEEREACFLGIGVIITDSTGFDRQQVVMRCAKMPNRVSELVCRAGSSWEFFSTPEYRSLSGSLCQGYGTDEESFCLAKADLLEKRLESR